MRNRIKGGYDHFIYRPDWLHGKYLLTWKYDRHYLHSGTYHHQNLRRETDFAGARKFARKWHATVPGPCWAWASKSEPMFWCLIHDQSVPDCACPSINDWDYLGVDPYREVPSESLLRDLDNRGKLERERES